MPNPARAQVFLSSAPHPTFTISPLFVVGVVRPDLGPVTVRVFWSITVPQGHSPSEIGDALYLLWPGDVLSPVGGPIEPGLQHYVEERGFTAVGGGLLPLETRDRIKLGTAAEGDRLAEQAPFVTFYKTGTNPTQSGMGTFIRIPWTPKLVDPAALLGFSMRVRDLITPKPSTWLEELFWGRRYVVALSAGSAGSIALYSMYFDQRDRVVGFGRDFSLLTASFSDADHLRIEEISPPSATRRPSRVRAGTETVSLPLVASEGATAQVLKVQFGYFVGPVAWRPILISAVFLILGNLMGTFMFAQQVSRFFRRRFHVERGDRPPGPVPGAEAMAGLAPGLPLAEVLRLCGPPGEELVRRRSPATRTLIYRSVRRVPHPRFRVGRIAAVSRWEQEEHEVEVTLEDDRVTGVETRLRRLRPR